MKPRSTVVLLAVCVMVAAALCLADVSPIGTWKLNEAKSKFNPGATKNSSVVYEAAGDDVKVTVDGIDKDGQPVHSEWTGKFDGKAYPVTGDSASDARSYKKINDRTYTFNELKGGKVVGTGRIVLSADGKTRTVTSSLDDGMGHKVRATAVYDKQ